MRRFRVVGVRVGLDIAEWLEGVFSIVILLKKPKKLLKLGRRSRVPSIREGLYLGDGIVDTFKDKI